MLSPQTLAEEPEVAQETEQGILKGGRLVLLHEEVAHPRAAVAAEQAIDHVHGVPRETEPNEAPARQTRADEVKQLGRRVRVLLQVVGPELLERAVLLHLVVLVDYRLSRQHPTLSPVVPSRRRRASSCLRSRYPNVTPVDPLSKQDSIKALAGIVGSESTRTQLSGQREASQRRKNARFFSLPPRHNRELTLGEKEC